MENLVSKIQNNNNKLSASAEESESTSLDVDDAIEGRKGQRLQRGGWIKSYNFDCEMADVRVKHRDTLLTKRHDYK